MAASNRPTRRGLLRGAAALSASVLSAPSALAGGWAASLAPASLAAAVRTRRPQDRLKLAAIGAAHRAAANIAGVMSEDIALLCDVDAGLLARGVAQIEKGGGPKPKTYVDWRELLEKETMDGIVVSTPDHTHAAIARAALRKGIPVYCEKPLTRTVAEARQLRALAETAGVPTQMGTQIHSTDNYRRVVEAIQAGAIGDVHTVHVVCSKSWSGGKYGEPTEVPKGLNWDLWLGPRPERPYCEGVHPANWRRFWDYGGGTVGDMACHWVDLVHWALRLGTPSTVEVEGSAPDEVGTPTWMHARWGHPAIEGRGAVEVHWWDGGKKPEFAPLGDCHVFLGTRGRIVSTYGSMDVQLTDKEAKWEAPEPSLIKSPGHYVEWLNAIKGEDAPAPLCEFGYASRLTETVLLANVAYRAGGKLTWDDEKGEASAGSEFIAEPERDGWDV